MNPPSNRQNLETFLQVLGNRILLIPISGYLVLSLLTDCANQRPPSGGPVDSIPPTILRTVPEIEATRVPASSEIIIEFSESIDKTSLENALFISPVVPDFKGVRWKGKQIHIQLPDGLISEQTYIISLGTGLKDRRQNRLKDSFSLAFSTGEKLDKGAISGLVYNPMGKVVGTQIWVFPLLPTTTNPDPGRIVPRYITQCNENGLFQFYFLSPGPYRIFAISDENNSKKYETGFDGIGIASKDILLTDSLNLTSDVFFQLSKIDTTGPRLIQAIPIDQRHIDLKFNEPLDPKSSGNRSNFLITSNKDTLQLPVSYLDFSDPSRIHLISEIQEPGADYTIQIGNILDMQLNPVLPAFNQFLFRGSTIPDTSSPRIIKISPRDSTKQVFLDEPVTIFFSKAMDTTNIGDKFIIRRYNFNIQGRYHWLNWATLRFTPNRLWSGGTSYNLILRADSIYDYFNIPLVEKKQPRSFQTITQDTLGAISGSLIDESQQGTGPYYLAAIPWNGRGTQFHTQILKAGTFSLPAILPGVYRISVYEDKDQDGRYSFGSAVPYFPAERFVVIKDSVKVRARWDTEGVEVRMKE